jgi:c(7)-type cytochrome triheme protein
MMRTRALHRLALIALVSSLPFSSAGAEVGDIVFARKEAGTEDIPPAIFPHWVHRMQFKCHVCHDAIIVMKAGANPINMEAIQQGKYCGVCHNGKTAFQATFETCARCHRQ